MIAMRTILAPITTNMVDTPILIAQKATVPHTALVAIPVQTLFGIIGTG